MFKDDSIINIKSLLNEEYIFYAHTGEVPDEENEALEKHISRCMKHFKSIIEVKGLNSIFKNFEDLWFPEQEGEYLEPFEALIVNTITFHDIGKINPLFQRLKMKNPMFLNEQGNLSLGTEHSIISAIIYLEYFLPKSMNFPKDIRKKFRLLTYVNAYVISKHHGNLGRFEEFLDSFYKDDGRNRIYTEIIREDYKKYFNEEILIFEGNSCKRSIHSIMNYKITKNENGIFLYAYEKLLYSLLVASDYYGTTEYNNKFVVDFHGTINDIQKIMNIYKTNDINQSIEKYRKTKYYQKGKSFENIKEINVLRSEMYLDAEETLLNNLEQNIFYLEAPTGSGKSNVAFNLSFRLIENCKNINKIMYIYPFNTLVEQNLNSIEEIFHGNKDVLANISVVNSVSPILKEDDDNYSFEKYVRALLDRQFFNYPVTLSTHVTLFDLMFGKNKESGFAFYQLSNSVIVLDEIQSYKNTIWTEIISFLKGFSKILNIKIIIMSATLPDLDILSEEQDEAVKLIRNRKKYFLHPLFKDRVILNYELLGMTSVIDELNMRIDTFLVNGKKILVEFIKKKSAIEFYKNFIKNKEVNFKIELMTGDDSSAERTRILNELDRAEEGVPFLLVATQVIEAGVDLKNIDIGFKDISKLDSEEQFMGRVNRSSTKEGVVYFFDYDNAKTLYKDDVRINDELILKSENMREILREKKFDVYYAEVLKMIRKQNESFAPEKNLSDFFLQVGKLNIPVISERMKLIHDDEWSCSVFLNRNLTSSSGEFLDGEKVWNEYKKLLKDKKDYDYAEWRIKLSMVKSKMNYFIYQINSKSLFPYTEQFGEIFYIEDAEQYFEGGKFIREKFENQVGTFI